MKKIVLTLICFFILCLSACSSDSTKKQTNFEKINDEVTTYFHEYYNDNNNYTKKSSDIFGLSSEGSLVEGYFKDNALKLISLTSYGDLGKSEYDYYIINEKTVYAVLTIYEYDKNITENPNIKKDYAKEYFIINNDVMNYSMEKNDIIKSSSNDIFTIFQKVKAKVLE